VPHGLKAYVEKDSQFKESSEYHFITSSFNTSGQYNDFLIIVYPLLEIGRRGKLVSRLKYLENFLTESEKA